MSEPLHVGGRDCSLGLCLLMGKNLCSASAEVQIAVQCALTALVNTTHFQNGVSSGYRAHLQTEAARSFQLFKCFTDILGPS